MRSIQIGLLLINIIIILGLRLWRYTRGDVEKGLSQMIPTFIIAKQKDKAHQNYQKQVMATPQLINKIKTKLNKSKI